ncbi:hypothetical protein JOD02_002080 [Caldicoprobacter guelmensis]|uniref:hypothetical protein n=1 Tax=Caldicoprobacter guelmensis TaxID=1170224 RepID=UPI0019589065|nr:hypothetical protein [Caldicoprobacter guelmensis]MBM7583202.1 hypothetical protein [Caldicoprobacter guelmensis]
MPYKFEIRRNDYLKRDTFGFCHQFYFGYKVPGNPDFLNTLKNTFNEELYNNLLIARDEVVKILMKDIPIILEKTGFLESLIVCVPRAKALSYYSPTQLMFLEAVKIAANCIPGVADGTDYIKRMVNTKTTHIKRQMSIPNDGPEPYPGITKDTCKIYRDKIKGKNIILIDDIYTKDVNVDEDCIQALFDSGAQEVVFYAVGHTIKNILSINNDFIKARLRTGEEVIFYPVCSKNT